MVFGVDPSEPLSKFFEEANNETPPSSTTKVFFMNMNSFMKFYGLSSKVVNVGCTM